MGCASKPAGNGKTTFISRNNTNLVWHRTLNILDSVSVHAFSYECINPSNILDLFQSTFSVSLSMIFLFPKQNPPYFSVADLLTYFQNYYKAMKAIQTSES